MKARKAQGTGEIGLGRRVAALAAALACAAALAPAVASAATISASGGAITLSDNFGDDALCSLREMVAISNADDAGIEDDCTVVDPLGTDTITLGAGTYQLSLVDGVPDITDRDLEVSDLGDRLTITGTSTAGTVIDGGDIDRVFNVSAIASFTLQQLTVQDGSLTSGNGGGIRADAALTLDNARVTSNEVGVGAGSGSGGGIQMLGSDLTLTSSSVDTNTADANGAGINLSSGAGMTANGPNTEIRDNDGALEGGGIANNTLTGGDITLNGGVTVSDNDTLVQGGGIFQADGSLLIQGAFVDDNHVTNANGSGGGGGIRFLSGGVGENMSVIAGGRVNGNDIAGVKATGGGISAVLNNGTGSLTITDAQVANNDVTVADDMDPSSTFQGGGGITVTGASAAGATITNSTLSDNDVVVNDPEDAPVGGAILDRGILTIDSSTLATNTLSGGGSNPIGAGLFASEAAGPTRVINSTFSSNNAGIGGSLGGALGANLTSFPVTIVHNTFAQNAAQNGEAINIGGAGQPLTFRGNLIAQGANGCFPVGLGGTINGFNVDGGTSCVGAVDDSDLENASAINLGLLMNNGGPTETRALGAGSQAINFVPNTAPDCRDLTGAALTVDQRGFDRPEPAGGACDAGAFEAQDTDNDGLVDVNDTCPAQSGPASNGGCPVPAMSTSTPTENAACEPLRQKIRKLSKRIKRAEDPDQKAKLRKKRRSARKQLAALGCSP